MEENIISVNVQLPNYIVEKLKNLAINKSEKTGKNVVWQDIFNQIYDHVIKHYVDDVIEDQLLENLALIE